MPNEIEQVLINWIDEAPSPVGQLPADSTPAKWIASRFLSWWRQYFEGRIDESFGDAERALGGIQLELHRHGGWDKFGEALHECIHLKDALEDLRCTLLLSKE